MSIYEQIKDDLGYLQLDRAAEVFATLAEDARTGDWTHEDRRGQLAAGCPVVLVEELELQGVEEALGHAVVAGNKRDLAGGVLANQPRAVSDASPTTSGPRRQRRGPPPTPRSTCSPHGPELNRHDRPPQLILHGTHPADVPHGPTQTPTPTPGKPTSGSSPKASRHRNPHDVVRPRQRLRRRGLHRHPDHGTRARHPIARPRAQSLRQDALDRLPRARAAQGHGAALRCARQLLLGGSRFMAGATFVDTTTAGCGATSRDLLSGPSFVRMPLQTYDPTLLAPPSAPEEARAERSRQRSGARLVRAR